MRPRLAESAPGAERVEQVEQVAEPLRQGPAQGLGLVRAQPALAPAWALPLAAALGLAREPAAEPQAEAPALQAQPEWEALPLALAVLRESARQAQRQQVPVRLQAEWEPAQVGPGAELPWAALADRGRGSPFAWWAAPAPPEPCPACSARA